MFLPLSHEIDVTIVASPSLEIDFKTQVENFDDRSRHLLLRSHDFTALEKISLLAFKKNHVQPQKVCVVLDPEDIGQLIIAWEQLEICFKVDEQGSGDELVDAMRNVHMMEGSDKTKKDQKEDEKPTFNRIKLLWDPPVVLKPGIDFSSIINSAESD